MHEFSIKNIDHDWNVALNKLGETTGSLLVYPAALAMAAAIENIKPAELNTAVAVGLIKDAS